MVVYQKIQRELSQEARLSLRFKEAEKENKRNQKKTKGKVNVLLMKFMNFDLKFKIIFRYDQNR